MMSGLTRFFASLAVMLAASGPCVAREIISLTNDFGILRDFSHITMSASDIQTARVFVDIDRFVVPNLSAAENSELQQIALEGLRTKLQIVRSKDEANYLVQIRMYQCPNYAIRNPQRESSHGFVMISICKFPVRNMSEDCENLQYDYFRYYKAKEVFSTVFRMWLKQTISNVD
jgi:hypothetical protein